MHLLNCIQSFSIFVFNGSACAAAKYLWKMHSTISRACQQISKLTNDVIVVSHGPLKVQTYIHMYIRFAG